ncbi:MAG TPA: glutathione S-transferase family protein [Steroidobacteraceae bacterium]|jgi:glutathione S-transferase|nr:glutathione S-transferase family protein [Steroidobacteraceae bacterium]
MYDLYIANKNYSSWSLRPWALMRELSIPFREHLVRFDDQAAWQAYRKLAPNGKVPCLVDGSTVVWDSLAIAEYLAERHPEVWPADAMARAWARSAAAEMHSGFGELRNRCSMTCGLRVRLRDKTAALDSDLRRLGTLWNDGLRRFGGPFLAGGAFTAVDAFFAPVAFRIQTYGLELDSTAAAYTARLLSLRALREWYADGIKEKFRDAPHDAEVLAVGEVIEDVRAT